jgi:hypothetical protein
MKPIAGVLVNMSSVPGCNVRSATNDTLIPMLMRDATINTTQPLLIRLVSNVTLGSNIERPIVLARPVLILGASSSLVSVDLRMAVNQFNVTRRNAQLAWQAVVLENLAPGELQTFQDTRCMSTPMLLLCFLWPAVDSVVSSEGCEGPSAECICIRGNAALRALSTVHTGTNLVLAEDGSGAPVRTRCMCACSPCLLLLWFTLQVMLHQP